MNLNTTTLWGLTLLFSAACGVAESTSDAVSTRSDAISNGMAVSVTDYPATAGLRYGNVTSGVTCTGTLIAPDVVLTAAHCITVPEAGGGPEASQWTVHFGDANVNDTTGPAPRRVRSITVHPEWDDSEVVLGLHDMAVLKLDAPVTGVQPVPLVKSPLAFGTALELVGYGRAVTTPMQASQLSGILRMGTNTTIACSSLPTGPNQPAIADNRSICFNTSSRAGTCSRDSGGPAYLRTAQGLVLAGVVSGGRNSNVGACGEFAVDTSVAHELQFLGQFAQDTGNTGTGGGTAGGMAGGMGGGSTGNFGLPPPPQQQPMMEAGCSSAPMLSSFLALGLLLRRRRSSIR